jgi:predicted SAM-dependent methyltransferase
MQLHLGCGRIRLPGYVNIDVQPLPGVDVCADLRRLPFAAGTVDMVYSCAVIEHFGRREWQPVLAHWFELLRPGAMLRLSTADFAACCDHYQETGRVADLLGLIIGGQKDDWDWHGMVFDFALLAEGLEAVGFRNVRRYDWRETDIGRWGIDDYSQAYLPHMDKANGRLMMLNVEADKPIV